MAQFLYEPDPAAAIGSTVAGLTNRYAGAIGEWTIQLASDGSGKRVLRFTAGAAGQALRLVTFDALPTGQDTEIVARFYARDSSDVFGGSLDGGVILRGAGNFNSFTGYRVDHRRARNGAPSVELARYVNNGYNAAPGTLTTSAPDAPLWAGGFVWSHIRSRIKGDRFTNRWWPDGGTEGTLWRGDNGGNEASYTLAPNVSGWVGLYAIEHSVEFEWVGIGTDGDPAPTPVMNAAPTVAITSPVSGSTVYEGDAVLFEGNATDDEDGALYGASLTWTSSLNGSLGTGTSLVRSDLAAGAHTITLTATDSGGATASATVSLTVEAVVSNAPPAQPTILSVTPLATRAQVQGSAWTDPDSGDAHRSTLWEVRRASDGAIVLRWREVAYDDRGWPLPSPPDLTATLLDPLQPGTDYEVRATYGDFRGADSAPSAWFGFATAAGEWNQRVTLGLIHKQPLWALTGPGTSHTFIGDPDAGTPLLLLEGVVEVGMQGLNSDHEVYVHPTAENATGRYMLDIAGEQHPRRMITTFGDRYTEFNGNAAPIASAHWPLVGVQIGVKESVLDGTVLRYFGTVDPVQVVLTALANAPAEPKPVAVGSVLFSGEQGSHLWTYARIYRSHTIELHNAHLTGGTNLRLQVLNAAGDVLAAGGEEADGVHRVGVRDLSFRYGGLPTLRLVTSDAAATVLWQAQPEDGIWGGDVWDLSLVEPEPEPAPGAVPDEEWIVFGPDDVTAELTCSALYPQTKRPFLTLEEQLAESEVDFTEGRSTIGQLNVRAIDKRTWPGNQRTGWITAKLSTAAGMSAQIGRRGLRRRWVAEESAFRVLLDGVISGVRLMPDLVTYEWQVRDMRERERKTAAFYETDTNTILPRGVRSGFGWNGTAWMVAPTTPLAATYSASSTRSGRINIDASNTTEARLVPGAAVPHLRYQWDSVAGLYTTPNAEIWWRPSGGTTWTQHRNRQGAPEGYLSPEYSFVSTGAATLNGEEVQVADWIHIFDPDSVALPADGQAVEVMIVYTGTPSDDYPLHLEGITAGDLLRDLYDGTYSDPGGFAPIRYDAAALTQFTEKVLARVTAPATDVRKWTEEHIYKPLGAAPALDTEGRISPVRLEREHIPATGPYIEPQPLTDAIVRQDGSDWDQGAGSAVNVVRVTYPRFYVPENPVHRTTGDGVATVPITREYMAGDSVALLGEKAWEASAVLFGALASETSGTDTGQTIAEARRDILLNIRRFGVQRWILPCRWSATKHLRVGNPVIVRVSWFPNYASGTRGVDRYGVITAIRDVDYATRVLTVEDVPPTTG